MASSARGSFFWPSQKRAFLRTAALAVLRQLDEHRDRFVVRQLRDAEDRLAADVVVGIIDGASQDAGGLLACLLRAACREVR